MEKNIIVIIKGVGNKYIIRDEVRMPDEFEVSFSGIMQYLLSLDRAGSVVDLDFNWVMNELRKRGDSVVLTRK